MYFTKIDKQRETIGSYTDGLAFVVQLDGKKRGEDGSQRNTKGLWSSSEGAVFHFPKLQGSIISLTLQAPRLKLQNVVICWLQAPFNSVTQLLHTLLVKVLSVQKEGFSLFNQFHSMKICSYIMYICLSAVLHCTKFKTWSVCSTKKPQTLCFHSSKSHCYW